MRSFASSGYLLSEARLEVRLVYTGFLMLTLIGFLTMAAFELKHIGPTPASVAAYWRGGTRGADMAFPKTFRELIELTHFHAFVIGIVYLVLAHLFLATSASDGVKRFGIVIAFAGVAGDLLAVWLIRYAAAAFAYLELLAWGCQWVGFGLLVYYPTKEMWFRNGRDTTPPE